MGAEADSVGQPFVQSPDDVKSTRSAVDLFPTLFRLAKDDGIGLPRPKVVVNQKRFGIGRPLGSEMSSVFGEERAPVRTLCGDENARCEIPRVLLFRRDLPTRVGRGQGRARLQKVHAGGALPGNKAEEQKQYSLHEMDHGW